MNRYPLWKYILVALVLALGFLYTLPNFFGEAPAVQVSSAKATRKLDPDLQARIQDALEAAKLKTDGAFYEASAAGGFIKVRLRDTDSQARARDLIQQLLNPDPTDPGYIVALNLLSRSPVWLTKIHALPMYLGLDLRGGVHFMLQVDMEQALLKKLDGAAATMRQTLRDKNIRYLGINRSADSVFLQFRDAPVRDQAKTLLSDAFADFDLREKSGPDGFGLTAMFKSAARKQVQDYAIQQNITTLHNRINELGVAEPVIQQQGADRIIVQLPGVQDTGKAKDILGRTATLEVRMVEDSPEAAAALASGSVPFGLEKYTERGGLPLLLKKQVILTGENLTDAQAGFDSQTHEPAVHLTLDSLGSRIFRDVTRENVNKRMAILLIEKGKGEVVTAPVIRGEIGGGRVQISGQMSTLEAADTALLLRAGSLAAPMEIIEERAIGPSLGAENIAKGFNSTLYGFLAIAIFMTGYYLLFGVFSVLALAVNVLLLIALLSILQATLTLPGIAAIALTLGMAIDANVLINERIREELRAGAAPQVAISAGYERAWATILDSNVTTLIAGVSLLIFGSGAIRGFAVVHCLGILTSIFSSVVVSRAIVNLWYGRRKKLARLAIGQVWVPPVQPGKTR
ncbi:MAG: protein translocase subunit SecD [Burkholderiaceae bacterium]